MADDLDFSLPERARGQAPGPGKGAYALLAVLLLLAAANLVLGLRPRAAVAASARSPGLGVEELEELALRLEKQGLHAAAVGTWTEYLASSAPDSQQSAKVWYRIGKIHQEAGQFESAVQSFYRSEAFFKLNDLRAEIGRRTQECLEAMGKFAALRLELNNRVGLSEDSKAEGDEVVAEIGRQRITRAELDRKIEEQIERQLSQFAAYLPPEERLKQKEALLKRVSTASERLRMLNQLVIEDVLYRKARETGLHEDPDTRALLQDTERRIFAQRLIEKEMSDQIKITASDLSTYYEAQKADYVQPEKAGISHILVEDEEKAAAVLKSLAAGEAFEQLARGASLDGTTAEKGGEVDGWVTKGAAALPGVGSDQATVARIFEVEAGTVLPEPVKSAKGFHVIKVRERQPERQKSFDEVREDVFRALRTRKEREVQEKLFQDLREQYGVVIHHARFAAAAQETDDGSGGKGTQK